MGNQDDHGLGQTLAAAVRAGDHDAVADIASRHLWTLFSRHHEELVEAAVSLPAESIRRFPELYLVHPASAVTMRSSRSSRASETLPRTDGGEGQEAFGRLLQMIAARACGDLHEAMAYARLLSGLIRQDRAGDTASARSPIWFFHEQLGSTLLCAGHTGAALREFASARQYGEAHRNVDAIRTTAGRAAIAHAVRGSLDEARAQLRIAQSLPTLSAAFHGNALSTERTAAALIAVERMDEDAQEQVGALGAVEDSDVIWPFIVLARVRHHLARHRPADALETVRVTETAHLVQSGTLADDVLAATRIDAHLVLGDVERARRIVESCHRPGPNTLLAQVKVAMHDSDLTEASRLHGVVSAQRMSPTLHAELHLVKACIESIRYGAVSPGVAARIAEFAAMRQFRRLLMCTPASVIAHVRSALTPQWVAAYDAAVAGLVFRPPVTARPALTPAERRVLDALGEHHSNAAVAAALGVSPNTVKSQLRSAFKKLHVSSREDAVAAAEQFSLFVETSEDDMAV